VDQYNAVGTASCYKMDGAGIEPQRKREFLQLSGLTLGPTHPPVQWILCLFPGCRVPRVWDWPPTPIKHWH